jgi:hypothetical protein
VSAVPTSSGDSEPFKKVEDCCPDAIFSALQQVKAMNSQIDFTSLASLAQEPPSTLMGCIRMAWPHIDAALKRNVTLKVIHQRLNEAGIPISYKLLSVYVARMQNAHMPESANN